MGHIVRLARIPNCGFCGGEGKTALAIVDAQVAGNGWAYMCEEHRKRWSVGGAYPAGQHTLENPLALKEPMPEPPVPGTVGAVVAQIKRDDFMREALKNPPMDRIEQMVFDMIPCEAVDGCITEPDGQCEHGYPSWPIALGII